MSKVTLTDQVIDPPQPAAGRHTVFAKSDGLYVIDDVGTVTGPFAQASGEANTASNVGGAAVVFKQKTGVNLEFRGFTAGNGVELTEQANDILIATIYGRDRAVVLNEGRITTTSDTFQLALQMVTPALTGVYEITWEAIVDQSNTGDSVEAQCENVTDGGLIGILQHHEPKDTDNRIYVGGERDVVFTGSPKTFEIQYREQNGSTAGIQGRRIKLKRVA